MATNDRDELERLRRQLEEVTSERDRLLIENRRLLYNSESSKKCSATPIDFTKPSPNMLEVTPKPPIASLLINRESPSSEKIKLFRSLFRGREDVFPRLWQNRQSGRTGYSPVCNHEWEPTLCGKPVVKCGDCPNRNFTTITDGIIQGHLEGKHTIGIYPLLPDGSCYLLAVDFDKQSWQKDVVAFLETCQRLNIPAVIERSRSGSGAHIWIFFSGAVSASVARKLGCYLITETMSQHYQMGMDSYDRLFPNQDTVQKGGFGNLIALPFQKGPAEKGNTIFLDRNLRPYQDQWAFLSSIICMTPSALDEVVHKAIRSGQVMGVRASSIDEEEQPWAITPSKQLRELPLAGPFPATVKVVVGNLIYIEKEGLPSSLLNRIKRLAAFQNPEFYKKQSLRLSTSLTPRVICCAEDFPKYLGVPRGCLGELQELLASVGIKPNIVDKRFKGTELKVSFLGKLTSTQETAVSDVIGHDNGVFVAPSGTGKTVIGIYLIAARATNTLILVHRRPLLEQWRSQLANFLGIDLSQIGQIGGGKYRKTGLVDVAMLQSLINKGKVEDIVAQYGQVVIDECHHLPAFTFEQVLRQVRARYIIGLTATPYRRDGHHPIILMQCGPVRHIVSDKSRRDQDSMMHRLICRDTSFTSPALGKEPSIHDIYSALVASEARNQMIIDDLLQALDAGRSPILLTERREHLEFFANRLVKSVPNLVMLRGGMGVRQRRAAAEQLAAIPDTEKRVLLATGRYIGEGFDDARLDTLFLAMPVSWKGTLMQYGGRLHRLHTGKVETRIYDYVDSDCPPLLRMFKKRLRGYRAMGYEQNNSGSSV